MAGELKMTKGACGFYASYLFFNSRGRKRAKDPWSTPQVLAMVLGAIATTSRVWRWASSPRTPMWDLSILTPRPRAVLVLQHLPEGTGAPGALGMHKQHQSWPRSHPDAHLRSPLNQAHSI